MTQRAPPKHPCKMDEFDNISNLPAHIIDNILSKLPISDAVRTGVLSSKWRYKWMTVPDLVFDSRCVTMVMPDPDLIKAKLVNVVDCVLLLHTGPINKFKLSHKDLNAVSDIDRWLLYISRSSVKDIVIEIWKGQRYKLPSCLFSSQNLIHLELFNCLLRPPSTFNGFKCLKSLDLQYITVEQDVIENLIAKCLVLERLTLMNFDGFSNLKIHAPRLQFVDLGGLFDDIWFEESSVLTVAAIALYVNAKDDRPGQASNLLKFFCHLPRIQRLEVQSYFLKYLAIGYVPGKLQAPCLDMSYLSLRINFCDGKENSAALCMLRSCPNIQELEMLARPEDQGSVGLATKFWEEKDSWNHMLFTQLKTVRVCGINGNPPEMDFIRFLLTNSPSLIKMSVKPASKDGGWELMKELLRFRRASVVAEIIFIDP